MAWIISLVVERMFVFLVFFVSGLYFGTGH
jgi:hypothetical protein